MDAELENEILLIVSDCPMSDLDDKLSKYEHLNVVEIVASGWIEDVDRVMHVLKKYRSSYTDSWLMQTCAYDLETNILKAMYEYGINLDAGYELNGKKTNYFTEMCSIKYDFSKFTFIVMDNLYFLFKAGCTYIPGVHEYMNDDAKKYLGID